MLAASATQTAAATPDWLTFVGALGLGALLAAAVSGGFQLLNGKADRRHENELRTADRTHEKELRLVDQEHERRMQATADRRSQRDRRAARIYSNLVRLVDLIVALKDEVQRLRVRPQEYTKTDPNLKEAVAKLEKERPALLLDAETQALFSRTGEAVQKWNVFWNALDAKEAAKGTGERLGEYTKAIADSAGDALLLLDKLIDEAREALEKAEAALE
jgi:hypothetical protein